MKTVEELELEVLELNERLQNLTTDSEVQVDLLNKENQALKRTNTKLMERIHIQSVNISDTKQVEEETPSLKDFMNKKLGGK